MLASLSLLAGAQGNPTGYAAWAGLGPSPDQAGPHLPRSALKLLSCSIVLGAWALCSAPSPQPPGCPWDSRKARESKVAAGPSLQL